MRFELDELATGRLQSFADWGSVPEEAGVDSVWRGSQFLYVGMARDGGLRSRMRSHASGRRSGDQFCVYICDRFVLPTLDHAQLRAVGESTRRLDDLTRDWIRSELTFRFVTTSDTYRAKEVEDRVRRQGLPGVGQPILNPRHQAD